MKQSLLLSIVLGCAWVLGACGGGGGGGGGPPPNIHFNVAPSLGLTVPGVSFTVTVVALDAGGNTDTSFAGTVTLSSSDGAASLQSPATLTQGTGTSTVTLNSPGNQTITATDTAFPSISNISPAISVLAVGAASSLRLDVSAAIATIGTPIQITVTAVDASGNTVASNTGSVKLTSSDGAAVMPAPSTLPQGQHTFAVTMGTSGPQTITATDTAAPTLTGQSQSIAVSGPATQLSVTFSQSTAWARAPLPIVVTALDASNNPSTSYSGSVLITSSDGQAILPTAPVALGFGTATFRAALESSGPQTFTATDTAQASIHGTSAPIVVTPPPQLTIDAQSLPQATVGSGYNRRVLRVCFRYQFPGGPCIRWGWRTVYGFPLTASGGIAPFNWSWAAAPGSSLPPEPTLAGNLINGIAPVGSVGTYDVVITVTDSGMPSAQAGRPFPLRIVNPPPPVIAVLPGPQGATLNQPYSYQFQVSFGLAPVTVSESGSLPPGLGPLTATGLLAGTPTSANLYPIIVHAIDAAGQDTPQPFTIGVFQHGFAPTGSMQNPRIEHSATLLADGRVLVTGGQTSAAVPEASAEIFDPAGSGSFTATGSMQSIRTLHSTTLLCDLSAPNCPAGTQVLIAGGANSSSTASSAAAELFDPPTGTFKVTGSMVTARWAHTATRLPNGKVLITGGVNGPSSPVAAAELYDPSTGNFAATGSMGSARYYHTATLLASGKVLVAGGLDASQTHLASAELYDPGTGLFTPALAAMTATRISHTATLLASGKVLIAGGADPAGAPVATAELYDPTAGSFTATGMLVTGRTVHTAVPLPNGTVLLAGGFFTSGELPHAELYDPTSGSFTSTGGMQVARIAHTMTALGASGKVLVTGGSSTGWSGQLATAELYQ